MTTQITSNIKISVSTSYEGTYYKADQMLGCGPIANPSLEYFRFIK